MNPAGRPWCAREALVAWLFSLKAERKCSPRGKTALRRGILGTWMGDTLQEMPIAWIGEVPIPLGGEKGCWGPAGWFSWIPAELRTSSLTSEVGNCS